MLFGSELFEEYIGQLAMASMASLDIFTEGEQFDAKKLQEKMRASSSLFLLNGFWVDLFLNLICFRALIYSFYSLTSVMPWLQSPNIKIE